MSNTSDFIIENGVLQKYVGTDGDVVIPDVVTDMNSRWNNKCSGLSLYTSCLLSE